MFNTIFCCFSLLEIFSDFSEWSGRNVVWWSTSEEHRAIIVVSLRYFWGRGPAKYLCLYRESRAITVSALSSCFVTNQLDCNSGSRWRQRRQFPEKPSYFIIIVLSLDVTGQFLLIRLHVYIDLTDCTLLSRFYLLEFLRFSWGEREGSKEERDQNIDFHLDSQSLSIFRLWQSWR